MTPKEKAEELVSSMRYKIYDLADGWNGGEIYKAAKQCALIAVDEIFSILDKEGYDEDDYKIIYWQEVKTEIEKL